MSDEWSQLLEAARREIPDAPAPEIPHLQSFWPYPTLNRDRGDRDRWAKLGEMDAQCRTCGWVFAEHSGIKCPSGLSGVFVVDGRWWDEDRCDDCGRADGTHDPAVEH